MRFYTSKVKHSRLNLQNFKINPWFVTGFTDGEGCFSITIFKDNQKNIGWRVQLIFEIGLNEKDKALLEQIKNKFKVRSVYRQGKCNSILS